MISSVTFETATFADAIKKADKVAPSKGAAFDKAAGIVLDFDPASALPLAIVKATNLEISSMEWVTVTQWAGERATWRLSSFLLASLASSLPIGSGKEVTLFSEPNGHSFQIHLTSGKTKARLFPIDVSYYPEWGAFSPDKMFPASDLGGRIDQVEWAASRSEDRLRGIYIDGQYAIATDTIRLARVPLSIPDLEAPMVLPAGILGSILKQTGDIQVGAGPSRLHIMPDDHTQIRSVVLDVSYPNVSKVMEKPFDSHIKTQRDALLEVIRRVDVFAQGDRASAIKLYIGRGEIAFYMKNEQMGQIGDIVEVPGHADHPRFDINFTSKNLLDAISKCPNNEIDLHYNQGVRKGMFKFDGGSGYEVWVMSRGTVE